MLSTKEILKALVDSVYKSVPGFEQIGIRRMPIGFRRPFLFGELDADKRTLCHTGLVERDVDLTLSIYVQSDKHGNTDADKLLDMQNDVLNALSPGVLYVADRVLTAIVSDGGADSDRAYIDVQLHFYDDLPMPEPLPEAGSLNVTVRLRE